LSSPTDRWTTWTNIESDVCGDHNVSMLGDCKPPRYPFGLQEVELLLGVTIGYIYISAEHELWADGLENAASALTSLQHAMKIIRFALTDLRSLILDMRPSEPEAGSTLLGLLTDLTTQP